MGCSIETFRSSVGLFVSTLHKILTRKSRIAAARVRGFRVNNLSSRVAVSCLLLMLLIGGVEPNPGPPPHPPTRHRQSTTANGSPNSDSNINSVSNTTANTQPTWEEMETTQILHNLSQSVQSLAGVVSRLEEGQQQLSSSLNDKLSNIQSTLHDKLQHLEGEQEVLRLDLDEMNNKQARVEEDTALLKETVNELTAKMEWLDTERRKQNLLFFGVTKQVGTSCEQLIKQVLRNQLSMTTDVVMEYAHWTGDAILVRFQSLKQRGLVLAQARQLTPDNRLSIREDFPKQVSNRRKGLVGLYKQLRKDNKRAVLRADKLHTDDGVFTYDVERQVIIMLGPPTRRRQDNSRAPGPGGPGDAAASAHTTTTTSTSPDDVASSSSSRGDVTGMEFSTLDGDAASSTGGGVQRPPSPGDRHRPVRLGGGHHQVPSLGDLRSSASFGGQQHFGPPQQRPDSTNATPSIAHTHISSPTHSVTYRSCASLDLPAKNVC